MGIFKDAVDYAVGKTGDTVAAQQSAIGNQDASNVVRAGTPQVIPSAGAAIDSSIGNGGQAYQTFTGPVPGTAPKASTMDRMAAALGPGPGQGPVLQNGTPIAGAQDMDLTKRGAAENFYNDNKAAYTTPGLGDSFAKAMLGQYANGTNLPQTSNNSQGAYDSFKAGPSSAGLDPYYQNANRVADEGINKALSARGMYGSSAADDQIRESHQNLAADEANRTADFDLRRAQLGGSLAGQADTSSLNSSANQRGWGTALGTLALGTDAADVNKLNSGMNAASAAQTQQGNRTENAFNNQLNFGDRLAGIMGGANTAALSTDQAGMESAANLRLGQGADAANAAAAKASAENASMDRAVNAGAGTSKLVTGIGDALGKAPAPTPAAPAPYSATAVYQYPQTNTYQGAAASGLGQY